MNIKKWDDEEANPFKDLKSIQEAIRTDSKIPVFADKESTKKLISENIDPVIPDEYPLNDIAGALKTARSDSDEGFTPDIKQFNR